MDGWDGSFPWNPLRRLELSSLCLGQSIRVRKGSKGVDVRGKNGSRSVVPPSTPAPDLIHLELLP